MKSVRPHPSLSCFAYRSFFKEEKSKKSHVLTTETP